MSTAVGTAVAHRIATQHVELIRIYGIEAVMDAIDDEAAFVGQVEEIGSSDISCWVNNIRKSLIRSYRDSCTGESAPQGADC